MIYLDNAATTFPKPEKVKNSVMLGMHISANPGRSGHRMSLRASEEVYMARKVLSDFFNLKKPENVIFTSNCTQSLNTAIRGLIKDGSHVICSDLEHNSVVRMLERMKNENRITYDAARTFPDENDTLKSFESLINGKTSAVVCTHASNVFADILPIEKIGKMCRKHGLAFIVDAAQSAGVIPIDMEKMNITALCIPGHKGLYASMGTGALLLNTDEIEPFVFGGTGSESSDFSQPEYLPDRLESGTLNLPGIMSMRAGAELVENIKVRRIHEHEMKLCRMLYSYLNDSKSYEVFSKSPFLNSAPIVSFRKIGTHSEETAQMLDGFGICTRAGYHCAYLAHKSRKSDKSGLVRVSTGIFNSENDIKNLINSLNKIEKA